MCKKDINWLGKIRKMGRKDKTEMKLRRGLIELCQITEIYSYLKQLGKLTNCMVILTCKDTLGYELTLELANQICMIGINTLLNEKHWRGYIGIVNAGVLVYEQLANPDESVIYEGIIDEKLIEVKSSPYNVDNETYIDIDGVDYAVNSRGINIVVYDNFTKQVVDSVCIDTHSKSFDFQRKEIRLCEEDRIWLALSEQKKMLKQLCKKGKETKNREITNLKKEMFYIRDKEALRERLKLENIIDSFGLCVKTDSFTETKQEKIKVRFFFFGAKILWNAMESLALAFQSDNRFDTLVILLYEGKMGKGKEEAVKKSGLNYKNEFEYDIKEDNPTITIFNEGRTIDGYKNESVSLCIWIPFALINGGITGGKSVFYQYFLNGQNKADYIIFEKIIYDALKETHQLTEKMFDFGNPKFDLIYKKVTGIKEYPAGWEKIKGKKVYLWASDHMWDTTNVTFDLYIKAFLDYFARQEEKALIIRTHSCYVYELLEHGIWSKKDFDLLRSYCDKTPNVVWDDTSDYGFSYRLADAVLTDINCGITVSALALGKPLGVLKRFDGNVCEPQYPELVENLYQIDSMEKATAFFEMVFKGEDPMLPERQKMFERYISHFDGKNGLRIKKFIENKYFEKQEKLFRGGILEWNLIFKQINKAAVC